MAWWGPTAPFPRTVEVTVPRAARAAAGRGATFGAHEVTTVAAHAAVSRTRRPTAIPVVVRYPVNAGWAGFGLAGWA